MILTDIFYGFGELLFTLFFLASISWRTITLYLVCMPFLLIMPFFIMILESPRFLFEKHRSEEAIQVLEEMSKFNGRRNVQSQLIDKSFYSKKRIYTFVDLFRYKSTRLSSIVQNVVFFSIFFVYNWILLNMVAVSNNPIYAGILISCSEIIAYLTLRTYLPLINITFSVVHPDHRAEVHHLRDALHRQHRQLLLHLHVARHLLRKDRADGICIGKRPLLLHSRLSDSSSASPSGCPTSTSASSTRPRCVATRSAS